MMREYEHPRTIGRYWYACACGHIMLFHDIQDLEQPLPVCCVDGCIGQCGYPTIDVIPADR